MLDKSTYRDRQVTYANRSLWTWKVILALTSPDDEIRGYQRFLSWFRNNDRKRGQPYNRSLETVLMI
jgi:hypothetical protein